MTTAEFTALLERHGILSEIHVLGGIFDKELESAAQELREWIAVERQQMLADFAAFSTPTCGCERCVGIKATVEKWKGKP